MRRILYVASVLFVLTVLMGCHHLQTPNSVSSEVLGFIDGVCNQLPGLVGPFCN